jgi:mono/diheme cytochrome c family protein
MSLQIIKLGAVCALLAVLGTVSAASPPPKPDTGALPPVELAANTPKGALANPYNDTQSNIVAEGEALFRSYSCSACHGAQGAGGLCPAVTNDIWVYGGDDDTLFRLIALGSGELQKEGYVRAGRENIVAAMPPFGGAIKSADDLWKMLTFIRARYAGTPDQKFGTQH